MGSASPAPAKAAPEKKPEKEKAKASAETEVQASQRKAEEAAREAMKEAKRQQQKARQQAAMLDRYRAATLLSRARHQRRGGGAVLVIPTGKAKPANLSEIVEDMNVMSRILDKKLDLARFKRPRILNASDRFYASRGALSEPGATESIYLQGYGALFLIRVGFPLLPPAAKAQGQIKAAADPLWEQTKLELHAPDAGTRRPAKARATEQEQKYDAEKVEDLKRKLVKALKHATNIRNLQQHESIIFAVLDGGGDHRRLASELYFITKPEGRVVQLGSATVTRLSYGVLVMRVKKSDVDAFAKGSVAFDKFRQLVQICAY